MTHLAEKPEPGALTRFIDLLLGGAEWLVRFSFAVLRAPFQRLPPLYGNTVPPDLGRFEAEAEEAQRHPRTTQVARMRHQHTHPARLDDSLERE